MKIGSHDTASRVIVIAEIGNNHEGNLDVAQQLVREAARCGVDAVKFQTFKAEHFVRPADTARMAQMRRFELKPEEFTALARLAKSLGLLFISTPLDLGSVNVLQPFVDCFKVASGDSNFYPLLARVADTGRPLIISTGVSDLAQVQETLRFVRQRWAQRSVSPEFAVLHCVSSYPVPDEQANLRSIPFLREQLGCTIGYSDHTQGEEAVVLAVAIGAQIIEKHFTLDHNFSEFRDHKVSADPLGMRSLGPRIRRVDGFLGVLNKKLQPCEPTVIAAIRRSVVAATDLPAGHRIESVDLMWMRPAGGLQPGEEDLLIGKVLRRAVQSGDLLSLSDAS